MNERINFNIFADAEFKFAIIFYVRTTRELKLGPKNGIKFKVLDWNNSYINFSIFEDAETKSAIVFHIRLIWVQNEALERSKIVSFWLEGLYQFQYFWGCQIGIHYYFSSPPFLRPKWGSRKTIKCKVFDLNKALQRHLLILVEKRVVEIARISSLKIKLNEKNIYLQHM